MIRSVVVFAQPTSEEERLTMQIPLLNIASGQRKDLVLVFMGAFRTALINRLSDKGFPTATA